LELDAKLRKIPHPKVLRSENAQLNLNAKRMSDNYGRLIFKFRSTGNADTQQDENVKGFIKFRSIIQNNSVNDVAFYQSVVRLFGIVLSECFDRADLPTVIMELERLFKTNLFNESARSLERVKMEEQYPMMKEFSAQELNANPAKEEQMRPMRQRLEQRLYLRRHLNVLPS